MKPLHGHEVVALDSAHRGALARFLSSLGALLRPVNLFELDSTLGAASFLIERIGSSQLAEQGWTQQRMSALNPALIHVSVTAFGSGGPRGHWRGAELIASATGGILRLNGQPERSPVKEALDACMFHADMVAAAGAMIAHYERSRSGQGQHVDVSAQEVALSRNVNSILMWQFERRKLHRAGGSLNYGKAPVRCIWALADGWCFHTLMTGAFGAPANQALSDWIDEAGLPNPMRGIDWKKYNRSTLDPDIRREWESAMAVFFRSRTKTDISAEGRRRDIHATVIASPEDVLADPHLMAREFWRHEDGKRHPSHFVKLSADADTPKVELIEHPAAARPGPLAGVRILDFSWALVGSISTKILGDLGAEVIKVESRTRPCLTRIDVQVGASRADSFDDKPWFAHLNSSKKSLALDLKQPASRDVINPLIKWADVVVENFSPGTMTKLGLDYAQLRKLNPGIVLVSGSVFGQSGPLSQEWGVDGTGAALAGRTYLTGWPDMDPVMPGAVPYGDVVVPYVMAAATAAMLAERRHSGRGCHIDASMYEICVQQTCDAILRTQSGEQLRRSGNREAHVFHQGLYPVAGADRWVAISCATRADWEMLRHVSGLSDAAEADRRDALISAWTEAQRGEDLVETLQSAGIAAGVVQDIEDLLQHDPQIAFRQTLTMLEHPLLGAFGHVRTPITFSRSQAAPFQAPRVGEHSLDIARSLAGIEPERVESMNQLGVFR